PESIGGFLFLSGGPPGAPLFPYPTLFRSRRRRGGRADAARYAGRDGGWGKGDGHRHDRGHGRRVRQGGAGRRTFLETRLDRGARDRKSTRLNSSHVSNSYAVFCLKKKSKL